MKFYKFISVILHPIVIPTVGIFIYFLFLGNIFSSEQRLSLISLTFITTYIIPLFILIIFKRLKIIESYYTESIKERKIPLGIMIIIFYLLGNTLYETAYFSDFGLLFYATSLGLVAIYTLFAIKFKTSIHMLSMGITIGFFLIIQIKYGLSFLPILVVFFLLSGVLASARLHLNAHNTKEVYIGFFTGFISPILLHLFL